MFFQIRKKEKGQIDADNNKEKILNIYPGLRPKHGGKGMYGINVHEAVIASGEKESGVSHIVDDHY